MDELPLHGIRVLDFSWIIAGPTSTRFLASMGAEVVKVGSARRPDPSTRGPAFQAYNQSKLYASLNITKPEGLELSKRLITISDVVIENFAAGVIERLGLGYEVVRSANPDIIMVASSGTGHYGPHTDYVAYGSLLQHYTGWNSISGYPGRGPVTGGLWADPWVGMELAMVTVASLNNRTLTGQGQYVDFSMAEALSACLPEAVLDYQMNDRVKEPIGNQDDFYSPHGVFHCAGEDRWVAIAVTSYEEWMALCGVIGRPDLASDDNYADAEGRRQHNDKLETAITDWTMHRSDREAMKLLQNAGVPSGPSQDILRVFQEPQLSETGYFSKVQARDGNTRYLPGLPWRFEGAQEPILTEAPVLGQHNEYVYGELLGLSAKDIDRLVEEEIIF